MPVPACNVSVIDCAYTMVRWEDMVAALDSARNQEPRPAELILVVDHNDELVPSAISSAALASRSGLSSPLDTDTVEVIR